nr:MAG TPA: hypothetical protein [Caudoviricetes sp.]
MLLSSRESDHHKGGQEESLPILNDSGQGERVRFVESKIVHLFKTSSRRLEHIDHFSKRRQRRIDIGTGSVQLLLKLSEFGLIDLGGIDSDLGSRFNTSDAGINRVGGDLPAQSLSFRRIIDGSVFTLGRSCGGTIDQVQLVAVIDASGIIADLGAVRETKLATSLLADGNASSRSGLAIARSELRRIGESLDGGTEFLGRGQGQVLNIVSILRRSFSARRRFSNTGQTVPSDAVFIPASIGLHRIQNTMINTGLISTFAGLIPNNSCHGILLSEINNKRIVMQIFSDVMPVKETFREHRDSIWYG